MQYDVIIIGGSYAGLSAGLSLARARRRVLVVDAGQRRNRFAASSHGFLTRDGAPPELIAAKGRAQLLAYPTVEWRDDSVTAIGGEAEAFSVSLAGGADVGARRLILAMGVTDELPELPGLAERWGRHVFHCPYCHGYELDRGRIGVLAVSEMSMHQALMLPDWGKTTLFLNGGTLEAEQRERLRARGAAVEAGEVSHLEGDRVDLVMRDGRTWPLEGLFVVTRIRPSPLAAGLGCEMEESPLGESIRTDGAQATSVPGVFACGDGARAAGSVALAVGDGAVAGMAAHRSLMFGLP